MGTPPKEGNPTHSFKHNSGFPSFGGVAESRGGFISVNKFPSQVYDSLKNTLSYPYHSTLFRMSNFIHKQKL
jgi:hypothetical protein